MLYARVKENSTCRSGCAIKRVRGVAIRRSLLRGEVNSGGKDIVVPIIGDGKSYPLNPTYKSLTPPRPPLVRGGICWGCFPFGKGVKLL